MTSTMQHTVRLALVILALIVQNSSAFSLKKVGRKISSTTAMSWSIQAPELPLPKSSWYDTVEGNGCFRQQHYDDDYVEFRFTPVGSNWPDYNAEKEATTATVTKTEAKRWRAPRIKPLQRIGNLIKKRRP